MRKWFRPDLDTRAQRWEALSQEIKRLRGQGFWRGQVIAIRRAWMVRIPSGYDRGPQFEVWIRVAPAQTRAFVYPGEQLLLEVAANESVAPLVRAALDTARQGPYLSTSPQQASYRFAPSL